MTDTEVIALGLLAVGYLIQTWRVRYWKANSQGWRCKAEEAWHREITALAPPAQELTR